METAGGGAKKKKFMNPEMEGERKTGRQSEEGRENK